MLFRANAELLHVLVSSAACPYHRCMRLLLALLLLSSICIAQTSRKPFFPMPASLEEFKATSSLAPELRATIASSTPASSCKPDGSEKYAVAQVDLQHGTQVTLVRIEQSCLCPPGGNCPIFAIQNGKVVLSDVQGFGYAISPNPKGGPSDLLIAFHTSANVTSLQRFRWKGSRFKLQDCQAAVRKDDARSAAWNPEELDTTSCDSIALK
jgi:hypothetical protein